MTKDQICNQLYNIYFIRSILIYLKPIILHVLLSCSKFEKWYNLSNVQVFYVYHGLTYP